MALNYWSEVLQRRIARRRALAATGGFASAAFVLACGGGGDDGEPQASSSLVTKPEDTFKSAKRGGVLKEVATADPPTLDPATPQASLNTHARHIYGTFVKEQSGYFKPSEGVLTGDLAESWEFSPDKLTITMKLRQGVKFHNRAPINGRALDMADALFSYERYAAESPIRGLVVNAASPEAPVLSVTAPDARTMVIKLKEPVVYIFNYFAGFSSHTGNIMIIPKETGSTFDIRRNMIGHGPFQLNEYTPSVGFSLTRNPDYWDKDFALVDEIQQPILTEAATRFAQLKAGNLSYFTPRAEEVFAAKKEDARLQIYATDFTSPTAVITFGQLPDGKSPFIDERVRQAFSMAINRDLWIDARYNVSRFETDGLPQTTAWNSHIIAEWGDWWIDPQGKDFGPNAKYFKYDLAEAKKLLAAAGFPNGFDTTSHYPVRVFDLGPDAVPLDGMIQELGLRPRLNAITDYNGEYIPTIRDGNGQFEGWGYHTITGAVPSRISETSALVSEHFPRSGVTFHGYSTSGKNDKSGDPEIVALLGKARLEHDREARKKLVHDAQRLLGKKMHSLMLPGGASGFTLAWPSLRNYRVYSAQPASNVAYRLWIDQTLPPFA